MRFTYITKIKIAGFLFVLPAIIYFSIFHFYPILRALFDSFFEFDLFTERIFVGFANYKIIFTSPQFINSLKATFIYMGGYCVIVWGLSFGLALLLNRKFPLRNFYQFVFFMPLVISIVVLSLTWFGIFMPEGLINNILSATRINWLTNSNLAIWVIIFLSVYKWSGLYVVIFLSGLNSIPQQYYDAAKMDGANELGLLRYITIPNLKSTFTFVIIISMLGSVKVLEPMYIITKGGPVDSTRVIALRIYEEAFKNFNMGRASAMAVVLLLMLLILTLMQFKFFDVKD
jgi:ABC-type sugar transport system permease subunit